MTLTAQPRTLRAQTNTLAPHPGCPGSFTSSCAPQILTEQGEEGTEEYVPVVVPLAISGRNRRFPFLLPPLVIRKKNARGRDSVATFITFGLRGTGHGFNAGGKEDAWFGRAYFR